MNKGFVIFIGVLLILGWSWCSIIRNNFVEFARLEPERPEGAGRVLAGRSGMAIRGEEVYRANNCAACHTLQARADGIVKFHPRKVPGTVETNFVYSGVDFKRGWGTRPTVLQDFIFDEHLLLGSARLGPDLANIGSRQPSARAHYLHLYNPKVPLPNSTMPPYPFLFEKRKIGASPSPDALVGIAKVEPGYEIVPTEDAKALVAYLLSLHSDYKIFPAPLPQAITNSVEEAGAAPAAAAAGPQK
jgi:cytochrome c oxidase cbb3-type subunit 2